MSKFLTVVLCCFLSLTSTLLGKSASPVIAVKKSLESAEIERLIAASQHLTVQRRIEFISKYLLGRKYHPDTKKRIAGQRSTKPKVKVEAANLAPLPVTTLRYGLKHLDCMTYVEHVLAIASCHNSPSESEFLCRLIDIVYNASGKALLSHHRNHFTSVWGDVNEQKGYLQNIARNAKHAVTRELYLNKVGDNRTFYVEDSFMIAAKPQIMWYFPVNTVLEGKVPMVSGDIVAMVTDKEGLDVTHMGFYIEQHGQRWLRHASLKLNRVVDQAFDDYLREGKHIKGLMVFRPLLKAGPPPAYHFRVLPKGK